MDIIDEVADYYYDHYGCDGQRLLQLLGYKVIAQKSKNLYLDILYPEQYNKIMETIKSKGGEKSDL